MLSRKHKILSGADIVAQRIKPLVAIPTTHVRVPGAVSAALLLIQLHAKAPGKAVDGDPHAWVPAINRGDLNGIPGSWLPPVTT